MTCVVCGRGKPTIATRVVQLGDVSARMCSECESDQYRIKRAVEVTKGLPRACGCGRCGS